MAPGALASAPADDAEHGFADGGGTNVLYCATSPDVAADSGHYYDNCRRQEPSAVATPELASELWDRSIDWLGLPH